jgi:hypothetical protein
MTVTVASYTVTWTESGGATITARALQRQVATSRGRLRHAPPTTAGPTARARRCHGPVAVIATKDRRSDHSVTTQTTRASSSCEMT